MSEKSGRGHSNKHMSDIGSSWINIVSNIYSLIFPLHIYHLLFGSTVRNNKQRESVLYAKHPLGAVSILISLQQLPSYFHELLTFGQDNTRQRRGWSQELLLCDG